MTIVSEPGLSRGMAAFCGNAHWLNPGAVSRDHQDSTEVVSIVEQKALTPTNSRPYAKSTPAYTLSRPRRCWRISTSSQPTMRIRRSFTLPTWPACCTAAGERVVAFRTDRPEEVRGAEHDCRTGALDADAARRHRNRLMAAGVTIFRPGNLRDRPRRGGCADTVIEPFVQLLGRHAGLAPTAASAPIRSWKTARWVTRS
jgi:bifunctional UDP-N-acetylglucosamine pyrophosphorylase/glucosamine-1-phosphate N-acetyltransferase